MKYSSSAAKKLVISEAEVKGLMAMRGSLEAIKKRYELLENSIKATEAEIISKLEDGVEVLCENELQIKIVERRYPHWKAHFSEIAGADAAEEILRKTHPTITKTLIVRGSK